MRSKWFPNKIARYAVDEELKAIRDGKIVVERDYEYDTQRELRAAELAIAAEVEEVEVEVLQEAPKVEGIQVCFLNISRVKVLLVNTLIATTSNGPPRRSSPTKNRLRSISTRRSSRCDRPDHSYLRLRINSRHRSRDPIFTIPQR